MHFTNWAKEKIGFEWFQPQENLHRIRFSTASIKLFSPQILYEMTFFWRRKYILYTHYFIERKKKCVILYREHPRLHLIYWQHSYYMFYPVFLPNAKNQEVLCPTKCSISFLKTSVLLVMFFFSFFCVCENFQCFEPPFSICIAYISPHRNIGSRQNSMLVLPKKHKTQRNRVCRAVLWCFGFTLHSYSFSYSLSILLIHTQHSE